MTLNHTDEFMKQKNRTVLVEKQICLRGLTTFGHSTNNKANLPLGDHFHKNKFEFVILVDGMQKYTASNIEYNLIGGDIFITLPNEIHSTGSSPQAVNEMIWFQIDISNNKDFLGLTGERCKDVLNRISAFKERKLHLHHNLINELVQSFKLISSDNPIDKIKGQALFIYNLLCIIEQKSTGTPISRDIECAKRFVFENIDEPISMDELVGSSNLSISHFKHKFKEQVGLTPREYINYVKIEKSKELLNNSDYSITEIAFNLGFTTSNYFCTVFKQFTGTSPKCWRSETRRTCR